MVAENLAQVQKNIEESCRKINRDPGEVMLIAVSKTKPVEMLKSENIGEKVVLVGWYENIRKVSKNLGFLILRDFYGTTQIVIETEEMMQIVDQQRIHDHGRGCCQRAFQQECSTRNRRYRGCS